MLVTTYAVGLSLALGYLWNEDFWWYLTTGQQILSEGWLPPHDVFLYPLEGTGGWVTHSWLWTVWVAATHALFGLGGVSILAALLVGLLLLFLFARGPLDRYGLINGLLATFVLAAANLRLLLRTEMVGLLLVALYIFLLERDRRPTRRTLVGIVLLQILWANIHGGFYLGILAVLAYAVGGALARDPHRPPLWLPVVLAAASLLTPSLWRGETGYAFMVLSDHGYLLEWRPTFESLALREPWFWLLAATTGAASFIRLAGKRRVSRALLLGGWAVIGAFALRFVPGFVLVWAIVLQLNLRDRGLDGSLPRGTVLRGAYFVAVAAFGLVGLVTAVELWRLRSVYELGQSRGTWSSLAPMSTAAGAADFIERQSLPGPILNDMELGGYLIHRLYPEHRLFIDTRQLDAGLVERYIRLMTRREAWREAEREFGFRTVVLSNLATVSPLALRAFLLDDPAWQLVHLDAQAAVFVRDPPAGMGVISRMDPPSILERAPGWWGTRVSRLFLRQDPDALAAQLLAVLGDLGRFEDLEREATRLVERRPEDPQLLRLRGAARLFAGSATTAAADLAISCASRPEDLATCYLLARALHESGRDDEARRELGRILAIDGTHRGALQLQERLDQSRD